MTYKITIHGVRGQAYALYDKGMLVHFINELDHSNAVFTLMPSVTMNEGTLKSLTGIKVQELKPRSASDKLALFSFMYKKAKGITYTPTREERANIAHVTVNEQLVNTYLKATQYPLQGLKTITDYIRHYNEVRDLATNGTPVKAEFPAVYDREYEKHICDDTAKLTRYWAHLRSLGWQKTDGVWKQS
jgi:hypothetical protein